MKFDANLERSADRHTLSQFTELEARLCAKLSQGHFITSPAKSRIAGCFCHRYFFRRADQRPTSTFHANRAQRSAKRFWPNEPKSRSGRRFGHSRTSRGKRPPSPNWWPTCRDRMLAILQWQSTEARNALRNSRTVFDRWSHSTMYAGNYRFRNQKSRLRSARSQSET